MHLGPVAWTISIVVLAAFLLVDVVVIGRRPHEPSSKEAGLFVGFYILLAVLFGLGIWAIFGARYAGEFYAGWVTEYSLSVDNLFVFLILMARLRVPRHLQQFALLVGIVLALLLRGLFIAVGAAAINAWAWIFFVFGAFLLFTAVKLVIDYRQHDDDQDQADNALVRLVRRVVPSTPDFHGTRVLTRVGGRRLMTPMLIVIVALGTTDLMFALDSIPAIYGLTQEPYLVLAANVFALMGLRQLYFLLGNMLRRLVYLSLGLSVILAFIGLKLILHAFHETGWDRALGFTAPEIPTWLSLVVIIATLIVTTVASLIKSNHEEQSSVATEASHRPDR